MIHGYRDTWFLYILSISLRKQKRNRKGVSVKRNVAKNADAEGVELLGIDACE
jgi:hypothetical protein